MINRGHNFKNLKRSGFAPRKFVYSKRTYANPFFRRKNSGLAAPAKLFAKKKLLIYLAAVIIIIIIWLIFFSNLFKINKIEIIGATDEVAKETQNLAWQQAGDKLVGKNNLLFFDKTALTTALNEKYYLSSLVIKKSLPHTLKISLAEEQPTAIWREDDQYYQLDAAGNVINQLDPLNINRATYPLIENLTEIKIVERRANINQTTIAYIVALFEEFKNQKHGFDLERFIVDKNVNTVKMALMGGPQIYFNTQIAVAGQAEKLDLIIKEKLRDDFKSKQYIDLRFGGNIYIK